jgi:hypothetical protein
MTPQTLQEGSHRISKSCQPLVLPRLEEKGYRATERSIQKVGEAQEFKRRRRRPGKTISSERRAQRK